MNNLQADTKTITATNLSNGDTILFEKKYCTPEWAVMYGYCQEHRMLSWLFQYRENQNEISKHLTLIYGEKTVACGDWCSILTTQPKGGQRCNREQTKVS